MLRRSLLKLGLGGVMGLPQRPDQYQSDTPPALGAGPRAGIIRAQQVIIFGTGPNTGLFVYSGAPALGNPPQFAVIAPGVTADPYGNAVTSSSILVQGSVITETSGIFRTAAAAPLMQLDGVHNAFLIYNVASGLAETVAPVGTSDGLGSTVLPGIATYTTSAPFIAIQMFSNLIQFQNASAQGGPWTANGPSLAYAGGTNGLTISSGTGGAGVVAASLALVPEPGAGGSAFTGSVSLANQAAPPNTLSINAPILFGGSGHLKVVSSATGGDGNTYGTERLIQQVSPRSQSFSAVAAANIGGLSVPVVAGTYMVRGRFIIEWNAAAGIPEMQFAGPAISQYDVSFRTRQSGSSSTANTNALVAAGTVNGTGYNGASPFVSVTGAMSAAGVFFDLDVWGMFVFTAQGTLTLQAASSIAGDAWLMFSGFWEVQPQ